MNDAWQPEQKSSKARFLRPPFFSREKGDGFGGRLRPRAFWAGWGGIATTIIVMGLVIALLVGWILLWVYRPDGPNIALLTIGCVAFSTILVVLGTVQNRLTAYWRVRQAQSAYLDGMSHNLRTPLSAIRTAAQTLSTHDVGSGTRERLLQAIIHETRRLGLRIDNALETGRFDVEGGDRMAGPVDLTQILNQSVNSMRDLIEGAGGNILAEVENGLWIEGDSRAIRLVIDNLLDNSVKYAVDQPSIRVEAISSIDWITISVHDQGIGMNPNELRRAFKRFWRAHPHRGGTGLGLALTRGIVHSHGGTVDLNSAGTNLGTSVTIRLPMMEEVNS